MSLVRMHKVHEDPDTIIFLKFSLLKDSSLEVNDYRNFSLMTVDQNGKNKIKGGWGKIQ